MERLSCGPASRLCEGVCDERSEKLPSIPNRELRFPNTDPLLVRYIVWTSARESVGDPGLLLVWGPASIIGVEGYLMFVATWFFGDAGSGV